MHIFNDNDQRAIDIISFCNFILNLLIKVLIELCIKKTICIAALNFYITLGPFGLFNRINPHRHGMK